MAQDVPGAQDSVLWSVFIEWCSWRCRQNPCLADRRSTSGQLQCRQWHYCLQFQKVATDDRPTG